jgi:hypothetical protein
MVVQPAILTYPKLPFGHGRKGREGINGVGKVRRGYIVKFQHPMYFSLRRAKERSIRTRPSTVSPRNFVFLVFLLSRRCRHQPMAMDGRQRRYQRGGKGAKGLYC